jgi:hypothetical protein
MSRFTATIRTEVGESQRQDGYFTGPRSAPRDPGACLASMEEFEAATAKTGRIQFSVFSFQCANSEKLNTEHRILNTAALLPPFLIFRHRPRLVPLRNLLMHFPDSFVYLQHLPR